MLAHLAQACFAFRRSIFSWLADGDELVVEGFQADAKGEHGWAVAARHGRRAREQLLRYSHSPAAPLPGRAGSRAPSRYVAGYFLEFFAVAFVLYRFSVVAKFFASLTPLASLVTSLCWAASSSSVCASVGIDEGLVFLMEQGPFHDRGFDLRGGLPLSDLWPMGTVVGVRAAALRVLMAPCPGCLALATRHPPGICLHESII